MDDPDSPTSPDSLSESRRWHHRPVHRFVPGSITMITASTLHKKHLFRGDQKLDLLEGTLLATLRDCGWRLHVWAVFSNHYHCIAEPLEGAVPLEKTIGRLHSQSSRLLNKLDATPGRHVWFQFWDTCLTHETSYFARFHYVLMNPVRHGMVAVAEQYPWCSAGYFFLEGDPTFRRRIVSYPFDSVNVTDDF